MLSSGMKPPRFVLQGPPSSLGLVASLWKQISLVSSASGCEVFDVTNLLDMSFGTFDPQTLASYKLLRPQLHKNGIAEEEFRALFSQCSKCRRLMTERSREHHKCPHGTVLRTSAEHARLTLLHLRLDCYSDDSRAGVSPMEFEQMFLQCLCCRLYLARPNAVVHNCQEEGSDGLMEV